MPGVLLDLRTGDPVLVDGDFVSISDEYTFYQIIDNLLSCQFGSEVFNPFYGFDLETALMIASDGGNSEMIVESLLADALDPKKEKLISKVDSIQATRVGNTMNVTVSVRSIFGTTITTSVTT